MPLQAILQIRNLLVWQIPCKKSQHVDFVWLYRQCNSMKYDMHQEIKYIPFYCATTDMWSRLNMTTSMSLTVHYIIADLTLHPKGLETRYDPDILLTLLEKTSSLFQNTGDWMSTYSASLQTMVLTLLSQEGILAGQDFGFGYNLHLAVSHGLDSNKDQAAHAIGLC